MSSTTYDLLYFPIAGRAEPIRLLFACAGVPFNDVAITNWPEPKAQMPLGQLPVLREKSANGEEFMIPQTSAILRHLARTLGFYGDSERAHTLADIVAETVFDVRMKFAPVAFAQIMKTPQEIIDKYWADLQQTLASVEKLLAGAPAGGFFAGEKPTYADALAFDTLHQHLLRKSDCLDHAPALQAFVARFRELPGVKAYLAKKG